MTISNELKNKIESLGKRGKEFGTVTSRRRCGWFDGVLVHKRSKFPGSMESLTKLDVLDELDEIKICIATN